VAVARLGSAGLIQFSSDGEFRIARNEQGLVDSPYAAGTHDVEGKTITFLGSCDSVWEAGLADSEDPLDEELHIVVTEEAAGSPRERS
jgi:hypothetical protein